MNFENMPKPEELLAEIKDMLGHLGFTPEFIGKTSKLVGWYAEQVYKRDQFNSSSLFTDIEKIFNSLAYYLMLYKRKEKLSREDILRLKMRLGKVNELYEDMLSAVTENNIISFPKK